jgi:hypothetical protein
MFRDRECNPGDRHHSRAQQQHVAQVMSRSDQADEQRQNGRTEKRYRCHESDLHGAKADCSQVGREYDDSEAVAEPTQATCPVEQMDIRATRAIHLHGRPWRALLPALQKQNKAHDMFILLSPVGVDGDRGQLPFIVQHDISGRS